MCGTLKDFDVLVKLNRATKSGERVAGSDGDPYEAHSAVVFSSDGLGVAIDDGAYFLIGVQELASLSDFALPPDVRGQFLEACSIVACGFGFNTADKTFFPSCREARIVAKKFRDQFLTLAQDARKLCGVASATGESRTSN